MKGNKMKATELLRADHQIVLEKLGILETSLGLTGEDSLKSIKEVVNFLSGELERHLLNEEEALFPPLEEFLGREGGPIGVMLAEHEDLRKTLEILRQTLKRENVESKELSLYGGRVIEVLRSHIFKEDNILFPMAEMHLDEAELEEIGRKMKGEKREGPQASPFILDVRALPPWERHPKIFDIFDGLKKGEALKIINDHDPRPLHYQFIMERPGQFEWQSKEISPREWEAVITRL